MFPRGGNRQVDNELKTSHAAASHWRIVRLGATGPAELAREAGLAAQRAGELLGCAETDRFSPNDRWRLAVVTDGEGDLRAKLLLAAHHIGPSKAAMLARKDIFVGQTDVGWAPPTNRATVGPSAKPRVAFLFAGQGSQYPGMLRELVDEFPPAADALREIDATLDRLGIPTFTQFAGPDSRELGQNVWLTPLSLLSADTILYRSLRAMGIVPDVVAGHSYGEFPALVAAGAWDFEAAVVATRARYQAVESHAEITGRMLSIAAPATNVENECREMGGQLYLANENAPRQTVVAGEADAVARLEERLLAQRIACKVIRVPRPFHTPLMAPVLGELADALRPIVFRRPAVPLVSNVTNRLVDDPEQIRRNMAVQITTPVRYVELIRRLADLGIRAIVEVGPDRILTGLHAKILAGRDVALAASDDKSRRGLSRLLAVQAQLECLGLLA